MEGGGQCQINDKRAYDEKHFHLSIHQNTNQPKTNQPPKTHEGRGLKEEFALGKVSHWGETSVLCMECFSKIQSTLGQTDRSF